MAAAGDVLPLRNAVPDRPAECGEGGKEVIHQTISNSAFRNFLQVRDAYLEVVRQRESIDPGNLYHMPLVPNVAFAPANDGILSHQAALPAGTARCWCGRHPRTESERQVNRVMF